MANATSSPGPTAGTLNWSDGQLLAATAESGSAGAFEIVVQRHMAMVYGVCRRLLGNDSDGEDAAQAVFLVLWKRAGRLTREGTIAAWLHRVARNICRNELRSRQARDRREREASMQRPTVSEPTTVSALRECLDEELNHLPEKYRTLLILFHLEEKSLEEVSLLTQSKPATIGTQLVRARQLLAQRLIRRGVVVSGLTLGALLASLNSSSAAPAGIVAATMQSVQSFAGATTTASAAATRSTAAAEAMLRSMTLAPLQIAAAAVAIVVAIAGGFFLIPATPPATAPRLTTAAPLPSVPLVQFDDGLYAGRIEAIASDWMTEFSATFFDDGRRLVVARALMGGAGDLRVWELPTGRLLHERFEPTGVVALAASRNGELLAYGCGNHEIRILATDTFSPVRTLTGQVLGPVGLAFSPDGRWLASSGWDWTIRVWDVASGESRAVEQAAGQLAGAVQFDSSSRRLLTGPSSKVIEWWDWDGQSLKRFSQISPATPASVASSIAAPGQRLVTIPRERSQVVVSSSEDGAVQQTWDIPPQDGRAVSVTSSIDAQTILAATDRGVIHAWHLDRESPAARWNAHDRRVVGLAVDSSGRLAVSIDMDGAIRVWNIDARTEVCRLTESCEPLSNGRPGLCSASLGARFHLVERQPGEWLLYETRTGQLVAQPAIPREEARAAAVSSDGQRLVTAGESGRIQVRDVASSSVVASHAVHSHPVTTLQLLPDDLRCLSGDSSGVVCVTELDSGRVLFRETLHDGPVRSCIVLRDGCWLTTAGDDGAIQLVDPDDLRGAVELGRHAAGVVALASGSSQTLIASADAAGEIRLWRLPSSGPSPPGGLERRLTRRDWQPDATHAVEPTVGAAREPVQRAADPAITALALSPLERTLLIGTEDATVVHFDVTADRAPRRISTMAPVNGLAFPDDDAALIVGLAGGQLYRQRASLAPSQTLSGHSGNVRFIAYAEGGARMFSGGEDKTIRKWDSQTGEPLGSADSGHGAVVTGALSPDGRRLVTAGYGTGMYFWDAEALTRTGARYDHGARVSALTFSPDGRWLASGSWDHIVRLWDPATQKVARKFDGLTKGVADIRFSPDGRLLAACSGNWTEWFLNGEVCVWEVDTGRLMFRHEGENGSYGSLRFTPDGQRLYATGTEILQIWETASGNLLETRIGHGGTSECDFLDPQTLIVRGHPHELRVWDVPSGQLRCSFAVPVTMLFDLATSPDERHFATATSDGRILLWNLSHD